MKTIFLLILLGLGSISVAANEVKFDFTGQALTGWSKTNGVTVIVNDGVLALDGTTWDSKVFRTVELTPGQAYELTVEGKGQLAVKLMPSWSETLTGVTIAGGAFQTAKVKFTASSSKLILAVQVNAAQGRAEVKKITATPIDSIAEEPKKLPPDSLSGVVWEENFLTRETADAMLNAQFVPGGGPDGSNAVSFTDSVGELAIDPGLLRGRLVTVEAWIKGENLNGGSLQIVPAYVQGPGEYYPGSRQADKGSFDWKQFNYSIRIPDYAGPLKLRFGHAGKGGKVDYAKVKFSLAPLPEENASPGLPVPAATRYRGAMIGSLRDDPQRAIDALGQVWHVNIVRCQFTGGEKENTPDKYRAWGQKQMADLDGKLGYFQKNNIKVVIDLHSGPAVTNEIMQNVGVWNTASQDMIVDLWREIARHYQGNPNIYGYDILNEPLEPAYVYREGGALDWNRLAGRIGKAIREIDPDTPIIVASAIGGGPVGFAALRPINVPNTIYTVHFYLPHGYTHQGVHGMPMIGRYPGVSYDGRIWDKDQLRKSLEPVREFQRRYQVPVLVGEFGVARWAPGGDEYLSDCIDLFEEYGWDWCYHAYREWSGWSAELSSDPNDTKQYETTPRKELLIRRMSKNQAR